MIVPGDTPIRAVIKCDQPGHPRPCEDTVVRAEVLDAHLDVVAFMHGKVSGMDSGIRVRVRLTLAAPGCI